MTSRRFEDYCRDRWGMGRNYVNKTSVAAEVVADLGTNVPAPASEAVARELAPLKDKPEQSKKAIRPISMRS